MEVSVEIEQQDLDHHLQEGRVYTFNTRVMQQGHSLKAYLLAQSTHQLLDF